MQPNDGLSGTVAPDRCPDRWGPYRLTLRHRPLHHQTMQEWLKYRFALAWTLPLAVGLGAAVSPAMAWAVLVLIQATLALAERVPALRH